MELTKESVEKEYKLKLTDQQIQEIKKGGIIRFLESVAGTGIKSGVAISLIDAPMEKVWAVIHDNNHFRDFMPRTVDSILFNPSAINHVLGLRFDHSTSNPDVLIDFIKKQEIPSMNTATGYFFSIIDMPWPLNNRWYIIKLTDIKEQNRWQQSWDMVIGNVKSIQGSWILTPYGSNTLTAYIVFTDPGFVLPDPLINLANNAVLPDIIRAVKKRAKKIQQ